MPTLADNLNHIVSQGIEILFNDIRRGIEKESLRVNDEGVLAKTPHPATLGSPLTHPQITTDYAEAQLEFVSPVARHIDSLTAFLTAVHHFTYQNIGSEKLWVNSMPCMLESDDGIQIARYGRSNVAQMKEAYRRGLGHRYGRLMQTISGIHYNFSLPDEFWTYYLGEQLRGTARRDAISAAYFGLIRNFHRHVWLLFYLFGASPAVCRTFLQGREHQLESGEGTFYAPHATSLRMSDIGYSNKAQSQIEVCYHTLEDYISTLKQALLTPHAAYQKIGTEVNGQWQQLNTHLLQIENEFYAVIRPKRVTASGEKPLHALAQRGVEYVEVRCMDLNPFVPIGINKETIYFLDIFLLYCLLSDSPDISLTEQQNIAENKAAAVMRGREPGLTLKRGEEEIELVQWAEDVITEMRAIARLLDNVKFSRQHSRILDYQLAKVRDVSRTPSDRILSEMADNDWSFFEFAHHKAAQHEQYFKHLRLNESTREAFAARSQQSLQDQADIEAADNKSFAQYLADYFAQ